MPQHYHDFVVTCGHNGLVNAAFLARAGKNALVLDPRATARGGKTLRQGMYIHRSFRFPSVPTES